MIVYILMGVWWVIGFVGFAFWWSSDSDFDAPVALLGVMIATAGPFTWIFGGFIHGHWWSKTIVKKRKP